MIIMTAGLRPAEGKNSELDTALRSLIPGTSGEPGVLEYRLFKSLDGSGYWFLERFASREALDEHMAKPYVKEVFDRFAELLAGDPEVRFHEFLDGFARECEF